MSDPVSNLRIRYNEIVRNVSRALHTQLGDAERLQVHRRDIILLVGAAELHRDSFPPGEFSTLCSSADEMIIDLDDACHRSNDIPDAPTLVVAVRTRTGKRGRPRLSIDPTFLRAALALRGPTGLAPVFNCHPRTVRRHALALGLVEAAQPVYRNTGQPDGGVTREYNVPAPITPPVLDDVALDAIIQDILTIFPSFGRRMIAAHLQSQGHEITRDRLQASYMRVHGTPAAFGNRAIHRRAYKVAGANSLWHHDGQHGLIRFKIVIHCFIDGKSHMITGLRVSNNNRAQTVFELFEKAIHQHGVPSRVRGDHGTENLVVAKWMEDNRGHGRGSYIWGRYFNPSSVAELSKLTPDYRSVHNTRIERLWYDVTSGFGQKWKNFFLELETHHGLYPRMPQHIWLLQHLFLPSIDQDAQEWVRVWNFHKMQIKGQRGRSPIDMFTFSLLQDGPRGITGLLEPTNEEVDNPEEYGIDWDAAADERLMAHLQVHNPQDTPDANPFSNAPATAAHVECQPPNCPFTDDQVSWLDATLQDRVDVSSRVMSTRRLVWVEALVLCHQLYDN